MLQELYIEKELLLQKNRLTEKELIQLDILNEVIDKERIRILETILNKYKGD